jgi:salicylate hydroxylase
MVAACLRRARDDGGDVAAALHDYAGRRRPRAARMLVAARSALSMFNEPDPEQVRARNGRLQGLARLDPLGEGSTGWLYAHDPVAAAAEAVPAEPVAEREHVRPDARRAAALWRGALTHEDRAGRWLGERAGFERFLAREFPPPADLRVDELVADGVPALAVTPPGARGDTVVVHLHGGGYTMGSANGAVELAGRLARAAGGWALVPDYRLAPEHAFPAALDDALRAYRWLLDEHQGAQLLLTGECAGGGLAVSLAVALRDAGDPLPARLQVVSPFCDLRVVAASTADPAGPEPWLDRDRLRGMAGSYLHDADPADPRVSPVLADLRGLPPLDVSAAAGEALADDALALADAAGLAGVDAALELVEDSVHSFVLFGFLPEARATVARLAG